MPAKCPKCNAEITYLDLEVKSSESFAVSYDPEGIYLLETDSGTGLSYSSRSADVETEVFYCPVCKVELATEDEEAVRILKGGA